MDIKRLVKEKNVIELPMGALMKQYNELVKWKHDGSILTLFFNRAITNYMDKHRVEIEATFIALSEINKKYFKSTSDDVLLKDPNGQLIPKETSDMAAYELEVQPLLGKMVEVEL
jgi:ribonuclease HIII